MSKRVDSDHRVGDSDVEEGGLRSPDPVRKAALTLLRSLRGDDL